MYWTAGMPGMQWDSLNKLISPRMTTQPCNTLHSFLMVKGISCMKDPQSFAAHLHNLRTSIHTPTRTP